MATLPFAGTERTGTGKGAARKLRQSGTVPAVIYGHGREPQSLALNARDLDRLLDRIAGTSTVVELTVGGRTARTLIREVQRHPFKKEVFHVDFQELVAGERITVNVPLRFTGTADGVRNGGGVLEEIMHQLKLRLDPIEIPDHIDVDVTPLTIGHSFHVRDLKLPAGVEVMDDAGATVCVCNAPKVEEAPAASTEGVVADAAAEPELIRKVKADEDEEK
jgi:large subunit ribosomal protein L25